MHQSAYDFVERLTRGLPRPDSVLEFGSRNVNGSVRPLLACAGVYIGVDAAPGPGVDEVADAASWGGRSGFDLCVCCETLEHARDGEGICRNAHARLRPGGVFLVTAAGPLRPPHSASGGTDPGGEFYRNVRESDLRGWLGCFAVAYIDAHSVPGDIYAWAVK